MTEGDTVYSENRRRWRLVQRMGNDHWMAHTVIDEAAHIDGVSPPLHIISEEYVTKGDNDA